MGRKGSSINGLALGTSYRKDIKSFYLSAINETGELYISVTNLMAEKGILVRSPYMSYPDKVEIVSDENFMAGYLTLHKRPLLAVEINHLSNIIEANLIGKTLISGFSQIAHSEEVRDHCQKGIKLGEGIIESIEEILSADNMSVPLGFQTYK